MGLIFWKVIVAIFAHSFKIYPCEINLVGREETVRQNSQLPQSISKQALHFGKSREVTREQHAKGDASACAFSRGLASLDLSGELASRLDLHMVS